MLMYIQKYDVSITYMKGKDLHLADCLSRAFITRNKTRRFWSNFHGRVFANLRKQIRDQKSQWKGWVSTRFKKSILQGWPDKKTEVPSKVMPYFPYKDEIRAQDGLLFRSQWVIIPFGMWQEMKTQIHSSHVGIDACLRRASECLYWPNMSNEIKDATGSLPFVKFATNTILARAKKP